MINTFVKTLDTRQLIFANTIILAHSTSFMLFSAVFDRALSPYSLLLFSF